ncbi:hypothetical protein KCP76_18955 [Salmonella enterica subsp. enterica serovar Weltevreden]|nr:hypothetical protein KCP76_18955 [Salmonella enterica subsp. enterica serovar Weltevreden]
MVKRGKMVGGIPWVGGSWRTPRLAQRLREAGAEVVRHRGEYAVCCVGEHGPPRLATVARRNILINAAPLCVW